MNIGLQLKIARVERELTQEELKEKAGISAATIGGIETGKGNPKLKTIITLATALGYRIKLSLMEANNEQNKESI